MELRLIFSIEGAIYEVMAFMCHTIWEILHSTPISQDGDAGVCYNRIEFLTEEEYARERMTHRKKCWKLEDNPR